VESKGFNYHPFGDVGASLADNLAMSLVRTRSDHSFSYRLLDSELSDGMGHRRPHTLRFSDRRH